MTFQVRQAPAKFSFKNDVVDFDILTKTFIEYMEDLADKEEVKKEIEKNEKWFNYSKIRSNYV